MGGSSHPGLELLPLQLHPAAHIIGVCPGMQVLLCRIRLLASLCECAQLQPTDRCLCYMLTKSMSGCKRKPPGTA